VGYEDYSRFYYVSLPSDDTDLTTAYSEQDYIDVSLEDGVRVSQNAIGGDFTIHQFKNFVGSDNSCIVEWRGQTNQAPSINAVYLQIYNQNTSMWGTIDFDNSSLADINFILTATISDLTDYKDGNLLISCRVWQQSL